MAMKKTMIVWAAAALVAAGPALAQEKVAFKLMGGIASVNGEDYNAGVLGAYRYALDNSANVTGGYKTLSSGANFQAEIVSYWGPHFGVGFGGGYYRLSNSSGIAGSAPVPDPTYDYTSTFTPKFSVMPFFINVHYKFQITGGAAPSSRSFSSTSPGKRRPRRIPCPKPRPSTPATRPSASRPDSAPAGGSRAGCRSSRTAFTAPARSRTSRATGS
jgi:hypothetical protein